MVDEQPSMGEVMRTLNRLELMIDRRMTSLEELVEKVTGDHEQRIRKVERWMYAVPPTLVFALGSIISQVVKAANG